MLRNTLAGVLWCPVSALGSIFESTCTNLHGHFRVAQLQESNEFADHNTVYQIHIIINYVTLVNQCEACLMSPMMIKLSKSPELWQFICVLEPTS